MEKQIKRQTILLLMILMGLNLKAQNSIQIDTMVYKYYNGFLKEYQTIERYQIQNTTDNELLTWISDASITGKTAKDIVIEYFKKPKGDTYYIAWMHEEDFGRPVSNWTIGFTFIKKIKPKECFAYQIVKSDKGPCLYEDRIVVLSRIEVEGCLNGIRLNDDFFFPYNCISLTSPHVISNRDKSTSPRKTKQETNKSN